MTTLRQHWANWHPAAKWSRRVSKPKLGYRTYCHWPHDHQVNCDSWRYSMLPKRRVILASVAQLGHGRRRYDAS